MVESSDRMWSTGEGDGKPLPYSCLENPMNSMKKGKPYSLPKRKSFKSQAHEDAEQVVKTKGCWDRIHAYSGPKFSLAFLGCWVKKKVKICH